jgi:siderophore synthetase component
MFERFSKEAKDVVRQAEVEARQLGARKIEAEHLLLAITRTAAIDLDHDDLVAALEDELRVSLAAVGVSLADYEPLPVHPTQGRVRFGTSAKASLARTVHDATGRGVKRIGPGQIARGVLLASRGTVRRALDAGGIDQHALLREL